MQILSGEVDSEPSPVYISLYLMPIGLPKKGLVDEMWTATRVRLYDVPNYVYRCRSRYHSFALGNAPSMQADGSSHKNRDTAVPYPAQLLFEAHQPGLFR